MSVMYMRSFFALTKSVYRSVPQRRRLERLLEQAAFALGVTFALSPWVATGPAPYALYLCAGLAAWYCFKEMLYDLPMRPARFSAYLRPHAAAQAPKLIAAQVLCTMPTLLLWLLCSLTLGAMYALPIRPVLLPYVLLCCIFNGLMQGALLLAFLPLFEAGAQTGFEITLPLLFWTAPIAWPLTSTDAVFVFAARLNPLYYLAQITRAMAGATAMPDAAHTWAFWGATSLVGVAGGLCLYRVWGRLQPIGVPIQPNQK